MTSMQPIVSTMKSRLRSKNSAFLPEWAIPAPIHPIRIIGFGAFYLYLIVYRYDDAELAEVRMIHGARDIGSVIR